jgi:hypothetical protein
MVDAPAVEASSGEAGGACALAACGGTLIGGWAVTSTCYGKGQPLAGMRCPRLSLDRSGLATTGQMAFNADSTYISSLNTRGHLLLTYDVSCPEYTCQSLEQSLRPTDPADPTTVSCQEASGVCTCDVEYKDAVDQEQGTYRFEQNVLVMKPKTATDPEHQHQYCVAGFDLKMTVPLETAANGETVVVGVYTLLKR